MIVYRVTIPISGTECEEIFFPTLKHCTDYIDEMISYDEIGAEDDGALIDEIRIDLPVKLDIDLLCHLLNRDYRVLKDRKLVYEYEFDDKTKEFKGREINE